MTELKPALIPVCDVRLNPLCQDRIQLDERTVGEYAESALEDFPPIKVYALDHELVLAVGHHTLAAHQKAGAEKIRAVIVKGGTLADAILAAVRSNATHGLRRTLEDRGRAVSLLLLHYPNWSTRQLAEAAGVSDDFAEKMRKAKEGDVHSPETANGQTKKRTGRDGRRTLASKFDAAEQRATVLAMLAADPDASIRAIAKAVGCSPTTVSAIRATGPDEPAAPPEVAAPPPPVVVLDCVGVPVPPALHPVFAPPGEADELPGILRGAADILAATAHEPQHFWLGKRLSRRYKTVVGSGKGKASLIELENAIACVLACRPYAACPTCDSTGKVCKKDGCQGSGFVTENAYNALPKAVRTAYEKKKVQP